MLSNLCPASAQSEPPSVRIEAPAKLNLSLAVGPHQADGYHLIESLMVPLDLCDELALSAGLPGAGVRLEVCGPTAAGVPADRSNLVWRAAELLAASANRPADVRITVHKRIPAGGGLGGGSSDAAATLIGLNRLWRLGRSRHELIEPASRLGSDVPFCVVGEPAWVRSRGERVEPLRPGVDPFPLPALWALLIFPGFALSTAAVYRRLDEARSGGAEGPNRKHALRGLRLFNELEPAALAECPPLRRLFERLDRSLGLPRLTVAGSGSTLCAVFDSANDAVCWEERVGRLMDIPTAVVAVRPAPADPGA